jgi:hypothetical protein
MTELVIANEPKMKKPKAPKKPKVEFDEINHGKDVVEPFVQTNGPEAKKVKKTKKKSEPEPTKQEKIDHLNESIEGVKKLFKKLREDDAKLLLSGLDVPCISELVKDELANLQDEQEHFEEMLEDLKDSDELVGQ